MPTQSFFKDKFIIITVLLSFIFLLTAIRMLTGLGSELDEIITARRLAVFGYAMLSSFISLSLFIIVVFKFLLDSSKRVQKEDHSS